MNNTANLLYASYKCILHYTGYKNKIQTSHSKRPHYQLYRTTTSIYGRYNRRRFIKINSKSNHDARRLRRTFPNAPMLHDSTSSNILSRISTRATVIITAPKSRPHISNKCHTLLVLSARILLTHDTLQTERRTTQH